MQKPLVGVVIASRAEFNIMRRGLETLRVMGVPYLFEVIPSHRTPVKAVEFASEAGARGIEVIIAAAGGAALLPAHLAAYTTLPIIGVPIDASPLRGQDALYSMVMMPPGLPIATVGINNSENAALLATHILALKHPRFREVLAHRRMSAVQRTESMQKELATEYPDLCEAERTAPLYHSNPSTDTEDYSESITPEVPEDSIRIHPGATYVDKAATAGANAQSLVSTPVPQEPGAAQPATPLFASPSSIASPITLPKISQRPQAPVYPESETPSPGGTPSPDLVGARRRTASSIAIAERTQQRPAKESGDETPPPVHTKIFRVDRSDINEDLIDHVMMVLLEGGIVGIPTDTVYGLAADATNREAVERLMKLKGREHQKTLGVLIHHPDMLEQLVREVPPELERVIEECWPGALTIILPKQPGPLLSVIRSDRIGIRIPSDKVCLAVISRIGRPMVMRNASIGANEPMTGPQPLIEHYSGYVDCIVDAGECPSEAGASTVLSAMGDRFEILREGGLSRERLKELLGDKLKD